MLRWFNLGLELGFGLTDKYVNYRSSMGCRFLRITKSDTGSKFHAVVGRTPWTHPARLQAKFSYWYEVRELLLARLIGSIVLIANVCRLSSSSSVTLPASGRAGRRVRRWSAAAGPDAWAFGLPTLHGGPVRLRPVNATRCSSAVTPIASANRRGAGESCDFRLISRTLIVSRCFVLLGLIACTQCIDAAYCYKCPCSVVCVFVCLSVCWATGWAAQKRLNWSRCHIWGADWLIWVWGTIIRFRWGQDPTVKGTFDRDDDAAFCQITLNTRCLFSPSL